VDIASALAKMVQGDEPLLLAADLDRARPVREERSVREEHPKASGDKPARGKPPQAPSQGMERFRVEVGRTHGIEPGNLVGAITSEADLTGAQIGRIDIRDDYSTIDLPAGMRSELFESLNRVRVRGQRLRLTVADGGEGSGNAPDTREAPRGDKKYGGKKKELKGSKSGKRRKGGKGDDGDKVKPKRKKDRHRNRGKRA